MADTQQDGFYRAIITALKPYLRIIIAGIIFLIGLLGFGIAGNVGAPNNGGVVTR